MICPKLECRFIRVDGETVEQLYCKASMRVMSADSPKVKLVCRSESGDYLHCFAYAGKPGPHRL